MKRLDLVLVVLAAGWLLGSAPAAYAGAPITCFGMAPTITGSGEIDGTPGDDVIVGSAGDDKIDGGGGGDVICGLGGNDDIVAGVEASLIDGGLGIDKCKVKPGIADCETTNASPL